MGVFEFVIALVVIGTVSGVITGGLKLEREKVKAKSRGYGEETDQLRGVVGEMHKDITKLKDRVRVLEKLVTDDDRRLADEIERLRRTEASPRA
jgi:predicted  nucleic acid-binding Zn-ribbon protein